jgi:CubicO group peptidase (beta-lactamase class C family)
MSAARLGRIGAYLQRHVERTSAPGVITLIARHGKIAHMECCGMMDMEAGKPMRPDAIFRIYSMSKPITCAALLMLFEEGLFQLTDPVSAFIPAFKDTKVFVRRTEGGVEVTDLKRPISIHDLLTHTSGLSYGFNQDTPVDDIYRTSLPRERDREPLGQAIDRLATMPLVSQPGTVWRYSFAHDVIGHLVSVVSGMSFPDFLRTRIFGPLGMADTGFHVPPEKIERLTALYSGVPGGKLVTVDAPATTKWADPLITPSGGGGLLSTAADYLRFAQMLLNGGTLDGVRLLGRKTVALMTRNHLAADLLPYAVSPGQPRWGWGYGLGVGVLMNAAEAEELASDGMYHWNGAASTRWWNDPQEGLVGLMMVQTLRGDLLPQIGQAFRVLAYQAIEE